MKLNARSSGLGGLALTLLLALALGAPAHAGKVPFPEPTPLPPPPPSLAITIVCQNSLVAPDGNFEYQPTCPAGDVALGGGFECVDTDMGYAPLAVTLSTDTFGYYGNGWQVIGTSDIGDSGACTACVSCTVGTCATCPTPP
jgi:hypothetical protein